MAEETTTCEMIRELERAIDSLRIPMMIGCKIVQPHPSSQRRIEILLATIARLR